MAAIVFTPNQDSYISQWYPTNNYGNNPNLWISRFSGPGDSYRTLIQFNLTNLVSNYIPPNSSIDSAVLQLYIWQNQIPAGQTITVKIYEVLQSWNENTVTWNNQPGVSSIYSVATIAAGFTGFFTASVTNLARGWYCGSGVNNGLLLVGDEQNNSLVGFYSKEWSFTNVWPRLIINYSSLG